MRGKLFVVLVAVLLLLAGCGGEMPANGGQDSTLSAEGSDSGSAVVSPKEQEVEKVPADSEKVQNGDIPQLGQTVTIARLKVTPFEIREDTDIGKIDGQWMVKPHGRFVAVKMRWENVDNKTLTEWPMMQIMNSDGIIYGAQSISDPEPSLSEDRMKFKLPARTSKTGYVTFDVTGEPSRFLFYLQGSGSSLDSNVWSLETPFDSKNGAGTGQE